MRIASFLFGTATCLMMRAQDVIVRQSADGPHFYYPELNTGAAVQEVLDDAIDGDTIYLAGVTYYLALNVPLTVDHQVVITGTGVHPDSATTAGRTVVSGNSGIWFETGSDGSELSGVIVENWVDIPNGCAEAVTGLRFKRCWFGGLGIGAAGNGCPSICTNTLVEQCVIGELRNKAASSTTVRNCHIGSFEGGMSDTQVDNCIMTALSGNTATHFRSCIFLLNLAFEYTLEEPAYFEDNVWVMPTGGDLNFGTNVLGAIGEDVVNGLDEVFVNVNTFGTWHSFDLDYRVLPAWLNEGYMGNGVGVYSGPAPWKEGMLPYNPHWIGLNSTGVTDNGTLPNAQIKASAQQP